MPIIEVDGEVLTQSMALYRFVAAKGGLIPADNTDAYWCDNIMDKFNDVFNAFANAG